MPLPNTRIVVVGAPSADRSFDVLDLSRARLAKLAKDLERGCLKAKRDLDRLMRTLPKGQ